MIDPRISSQVAPTSCASCAWRRTPSGLRRLTVSAMRMSSCVFRSGASSESICAIHAFCAAWSCGKTSCSGSSNAKFQSCSWSFTAANLVIRLRRRGGAEYRDRDLVVERLEVDPDRHADAQVLEPRALDIRHHARALFEADDGRHVLAP